MIDAPEPLGKIWSSKMIIEDREKMDEVREFLRRAFALHRGRQAAVDRASGHAPGWNRTVLGRPVMRLTGYQLLASARGMGLDLGELLSEAAEPSPTELLRKVREATHGKREDTLVKLPTVKVKAKTDTKSGNAKEETKTENVDTKASGAKAEDGARTAETEDKEKKIVLKTPPSAILRLQSAARQVACNRLDPAQQQQQSAPTTEEACACLLYAPLNHRRKVLRLEPRWRSLAGVTSAALAIDKLRLRAPEDAMALGQILAVEIATKIKGPDAGEAFCRAAGALGSAHRLAASMEGAAFCLETVSAISPWAPPAVRADLLRRASVVLMAYGEMEAALAVSDQAMAIYAAQRDTSGMGKVFVDQGVFLVALDPPKATNKYKNGLALLPDSDETHRAAAFQGLARVAELAKRFDQAEEYLQQALPLILAEDTYTSAQAQKIAGLLAKQSGQFSIAEVHLRTAADKLAEINPFDAVIAALYLIELLLERGRPVEANKRAKEMTWLLEAFRHNKIAKAALDHLTHLAYQGELDSGAIEVARKAVQGGRRQGIRPPHWR